LNIKSFFSHKILSTTQPPYLYDVVSILQPPQGHNTRSLPYVTLIKPQSSFKVTHRGPSDMLQLIFGTSYFYIT